MYPYLYDFKYTKWPNLLIIKEIIRYTGGYTKYLLVYGGVYQIKYQKIKHLVYLVYSFLYYQGFFKVFEKFNLRSKKWRDSTL